MNTQYSMPKRQNYTTQDSVMWLTTIIERAYRLAGQNTYTKKDMAALTADFASELTNKYSYLQPFEVKMAVEEGCKGYYGDFQGINMRSLVIFIKGYLQSGERTAYLKKVEEEYNIAQGYVRIAHVATAVEDPMTVAKRLVNENYLTFVRGGIIQDWFWRFLNTRLRQCGVIVPDARVYFSDCKSKGMRVIFS